MINVQGPDGSNVAFPDGTPAGEITAALDAHFGASKNVSRGTTGQASAESGGAAPSLPEGIVRATGTGIPVAGGLLNKLDAATNALLAPYLDKYLPENFDKLPESGFADRLAHAERLQQAKDKSFSEQHPVLQTGAEIAGGLGSTGALIKTAPAVAQKVLGLGAETLPGQVAQGAVAGAGLGAADSATRGQDVTTGAMVGGMGGAAAPVLANVAGRAVNAIRGLRTPTEPQVFTDVAGKKVPLTVGQQTGDVNAIMDEQRALRGGDSPKATAVARDYFDNVQGPAVQEAGQEVARRMSPTGELLASSPNEAGEAILGAAGQRGMQEAAQAGDVQSQIAAMRQAEQAAGQQATARVGQQAQSLMESFHPQKQVVANSPVEAGQVLQDSISQARSNAKQAAGEAYDAVRDAPGRYHPASFNGIAGRIQNAVVQAARDSVPEITPETTPWAARALAGLEDATSGLVQQREGGRIVAGQPITGQVVDNARKRLNAYYRGALQAARATGNQADAAAMREIISAFDGEVQNALSQGKYIGGDGQALAQKMAQARSLYSDYRKTFTRQGSGDRVGPLMEKIVGQHEGQEAPIEQVGQMLTKGNNAPLLGKRAVQIFGQDSPEIGAVKQGLFSQLSKDPLGNALHPEKAADNIEGFLRNNSLAGVYFKPNEQQALASHAADLRRSVRGSIFEKLHGSSSADTAANVEGFLKSPDAARVYGSDQAKLADYAAAHRQAADYANRQSSVGGRLMDELKGLTGRQPTASDVVSTVLNPRNGRERAVELARAIKGQLGENSQAHVALKQGLFAQALENKTGPLDVGSKVVITKLQELLHGAGKPLANEVYSPAERELLQSYLDLMNKLTPPSGTVNYSNTATVMSRMFRVAIDGFFGGLGAFHFGPAGALAGIAADRTNAALKDTIRSAKVAKLLYGTPQGLHAMADLQRTLGNLAAFGQRSTLPVMH